jgi:hypothetical protein
MKVIEYIKARISERSTWTAIGVGVTGAATLSAPWSYVFVGIAVIGALVPTGGSADNG